MNRRKSNRRFVILVFAVSLLGFVLLFTGMRKEKMNIERERIQYITDSQVSKLKATLSKYLNNAVIWEMLAVETEGNVQHFDEIAAKLYESDSAIRSIQLAPDGVVTQVYPLEGNEEAFGDLFSDPARRTEAEYARDTGEMTLSGPFDLYQGGMGLIARQPVYLEDGNGVSRFWGFAIVVLDVPQIFEAAELPQMYQAGYEYKLWRTNPDTNDVQVILESSSQILHNPTQMSFEVPNATWTFDAAPIGGWINLKECMLYSLLSLLLASLMAVITWLILRLKSQKEKMAALSYSDGLTDLHNLRKLLEVLKKYDRTRTAFGVVFLDLNGFKQINDKYGHDVGDKLLIAVAGRLSNIKLRQPKDVFRIGGDEFIVLLEGDYDRDFYESLMKQIKQVLAQDIKLGNNTLLIRTSAGFARFPHDAQAAEDIIKIADGKMYEEKHAL